MVSRRNFFTITAMLLVICFMFIMIALVKEIWNDYDTNEYETSTDSAFTRDDIWEPEKEETSVDQTVLFVGDIEGDIGRVVSQWAQYAKREIENAASLRKVTGTPYLVILDGTAVKDTIDVDVLQRLVGEGTHLIFCSLPDVSVLHESEELQSILGIRYIIMDEVELSGIHLFDNFLLGGETIYEATTEKEEKKQDLQLTVPWYLISSGTKTYAMGLFAHQEDYINSELTTEDQNEQLPAIIWRNSVDTARVFAVNGPYMQDVTGIGFLQAMLYEIEDYMLYPVVNAQNLSVVNAPCLADENAEQINDIYCRLPTALFRDLVWPEIVSVEHHSYLTAGCLLTSQLVYNDEALPREDVLNSSLKMLKEGRAEVGLSTDRRGGTSLSEKLEADAAFMKQTDSRYAYRALYVPDDDLPEVSVTEAPETETPKPAPSVKETPKPAPSATETPKPAPSGTEMPKPAPSATETPKPAPSGTETPKPAPSATETPKPAPSGTETPKPAPSGTEMPKPAPSATETPKPVPSATETPKPKPSGTETPKPVSSGTETPKPAPSATETPETKAPLEYDYLQDVRTVVTDYAPCEQLLGYADKNVTIQRATADAFSHTYTEDLRLKSLQTALGYSHILLDMENIIWPKNEDERWEKLVEEFSSNTVTYWRPFSGFDGTSFSESDQRIRRFLALDYQNTRKDDVITLKLDRFEEEAWFLLRTHGEEIQEITGAAYTELEEDTFLLHIQKAKVQITLKSRLELFYPDKEERKQ